MSLNSSVFDQWINASRQYTWPQLLRKEAPDRWSMGQLLIHLVESTDFFLENATLCLANPANAEESCTPAGREILFRSQLPDKDIEGPASNKVTPQPLSREEPERELLRLKGVFEERCRQVISQPVSGKIKHPGLGYFNAAEWLQFSEIHLRHHFRQKRKIDAFLQSSDTNTFKEAGP